MSELSQHLLDTAHAMNSAIREQVFAPRLLTHYLTGYDEARFDAQLAEALGDGWQLIESTVSHQDGFRMARLERFEGLPGVPTRIKLECGATVRNMDAGKEQQKETV